MKAVFNLTLVLMMMFPVLAQAEAVAGKPAPLFEGKDASGKAHSLTAYKGKWLVLEWFNKDCPYVKKHYGSQNMQNLQKEYSQRGVSWLTINSSAKGKQGYTKPSEALKVAKDSGSAANAVILDSSGVIGKAYGAKTTPHMFIINPEGVVVYAGGIDDNNSSDPAVIPNSKNFVKAALDEALAGKDVSVKTSRPYGCGVKY